MSFSSSYVLALNKLSNEKRTQKALMKLSPRRRQYDALRHFPQELEDTEKLGYNELGYNKPSVIMNKIFSPK
jgi:hypothetical protein